MESADTLPEPTTIERLLEPMCGNPDIGMTGGHPVPINDKSTFMGYAVHLLWQLHHQIAIKKPKLGELTAFRRVFYRIPYDSAVDEANMEPLSQARATSSLCARGHRLQQRRRNRARLPQAAQAYPRRPPPHVP